MRKSENPTKNPTRETRPRRHQNFLQNTWKRTVNRQPWCSREKLLETDVSSCVKQQNCSQHMSHVNSPKYVPSGNISAKSTKIGQPSMSPRRSQNKIVWLERTPNRRTRVLGQNLIFPKTWHSHQHRLSAPSMCFVVLFYVFVVFVFCLLCFGVFSLCVVFLFRGFCCLAPLGGAGP